MATKIGWIAVAALAVAYAEEAVPEGRATLLVYKKLSQAEGHSVNTPFNVTISVFNRGEQR